jgi:histidyl-tRNA synthetase
VRVITLNDDEALINYTKPIVAELRVNMVRVDSDFSATLFKTKIADAEQQRVHTILVIGGRDMEAGAVSVRLHSTGNLGAKPKRGSGGGYSGGDQRAAGVTVGCDQPAVIFLSKSGNDNRPVKALRKLQGIAFDEREEIGAGDIGTNGCPVREIA